MNKLNSKYVYDYGRDILTNSGAQFSYEIILPFYNLSDVR